MKQEIINLIVENKIAVVMFLQFIVHSGLVYWVKPGKKSFKGFIKFLVMKSDEPKV